jgi:hypothetical protein
MNAVSQFYLMEIDEQPKGDIQQFHVAQELCFVDGRIFSTAFASTKTHPPSQETTERTESFRQSLLLPM